MNMCIAYACIKYCTRVPMHTRVGEITYVRIADLALERFSEEDCGKLVAYNSMNKF